ncbi:MAG: DUF4249 family protein [Flavobacteriia bacterium]|jgi:hypothetical protein
MKYTLILLSLFSLFLSACSKEVKIDIPGYEQQVVIDGSIETDAPPLVLLSKSNDIYSPTNLDAYLENFISGAIVTVSNGLTTVQLDEICTDNLPAGTEEIAAGIFGIPAAELANFHLCAYTSFNTDIWGQVGKTYNLTVTFDGKTYTSSTTILQSTPPVNMFYKLSGSFTDKGYSWVTLNDPPNQYDAYKLQYKRSGKPQFEDVWNPFFDDQFFDGKTFDFSFDDKTTYDDPNVPDNVKGYFNLGDTVILKLSKLDRSAYEFFEKKYNQLFNAGNPFSTPTNVPTNIKGGALGVWVGYSPAYDTLVCIP